MNFNKAMFVSSAILLIVLALTNFYETAAGAKAPANVPLPILKKAKGADEPVPGLGLKDDLAPLNDYTFTNPDEQSALDQALAALYKNNEDLATTHFKDLHDPVARKLVTWYALRSVDLDHPVSELEAFLKDNPAWPDEMRFIAKIERRILKGQEENIDPLKYFEKHPPRTTLGIIAHAEALFKAGKTKEAVAIIRKTYQKPTLSIWMERRIIANYKEHLTTADHKIRMDRLLYTNKRSNVAAAMRAAKYLSAAEQAGAKFRSAITQRAYGTARKLFDTLDSEVKKSPGVTYARIKLAQRTRQSKRALTLLKAAKYKKEDVSDKDAWWKERSRYARDAIINHDYKTAYLLTSRHEHPSVNLYKDAEFLSGWLALRFLKKTDKAVTHFQNFAKAADGPLSTSKSHYWLGRALKAQKKNKEAEESFKKSAALFNTYYGQLSAAELGADKAVITIPEPLDITPEIAKKFLARDEIKAIILAHRVGRDAVVRIFFAHLRYHLTDPSEVTLLAELAASLGYNQSTVRIGKTALAQNMMPLAHYSYPLRFMPEYTPLRSVPEEAIVYSIARQESEFNYEIKSHAGARGLLQVMPNTLKHIARKYKIKWHTAWLTQKPEYNAQVASAYIGDRHDEFGGSYIMTFAGFNAGPGRVRQWIKKFGDPRTGKIDPIDWVEHIPFTETRKYVQKVMSNLQVYRARLANGKIRIKSDKDLHRGKF